MRQTYVKYNSELPRNCSPSPDCFNKVAFIYELEEVSITFGETESKQLSHINLQYDHGNGS